MILPRGDIVNILGIPIAAVNLKRAVAVIEQIIADNMKTYVTVTGVHGIMESQRDPELMHIHRDAAMCLPDGVPTVWLGRYYGHRSMRRVYGPDLMLALIGDSIGKKYSHFLFGGKPGVPEKLAMRLQQLFPSIRIIGTYSPPFRKMTDIEEDSVRALLGRLTPDILWVGLSTPKQERWMFEHCTKLNAGVMIGVGAAFDFHAGIIRQAPKWVQSIGMEWFFRLCVEPRRLWRRYARNNPAFLIKIACQLLRWRQYEL